MHAAVPCCQGKKMEIKEMLNKQRRTTTTGQLIRREKKTQFTSSKHGVQHSSKKDANKSHHNISMHKDRQENHWARNKNQQINLTAKKTQQKQGEITLEASAETRTRFTWNAAILPSHGHTATTTTFTLCLPVTCSTPLSSRLVRVGGACTRVALTWTGVGGVWCMLGRACALVGGSWARVDAWRTMGGVWGMGRVRLTVGGVRVFRRAGCHVQVGWQPPPTLELLWRLRGRPDAGSHGLPFTCKNIVMTTSTSLKTFLFTSAYSELL